MSSEINAPIYLLREFDAANDYPVAVEWWTAHQTTKAPLREMLPKLGLVASNEHGDPHAFAWLFMDNSVGVCFVEFPVTKPGIGLRRARLAFDAILFGLKEAARAMNYGVMIAYTLPAIARELRTRHGFSECRSGMVMLAAPTTP